MQIEPMIAAVRDACRLTRTLQQRAVQGIDKFSAAKNASEPVTIADYGAQALIGRAIMQHYPDDGALGEESGQQFAQIVASDQQQVVIGLLSDILGEPVSVEDVVTWLDYGKDRCAARTWVIDPIDGTRGFISGRHYAICAGTLENGVPTNAVMGCPHYAPGNGAPPGAIFYTSGGALYRADMEGQHAQRVSVSARANAAEWIAVQSYEDAARGKKDAEKVLKAANLYGLVRIQEIDSMEKYALVGCGDADLMIRLPEAGRTSPHMIWDHVAGVALVLAGGGMATDYNGQPLDFSQGKTLPNRGMLISSGIMHDSIARTAAGLV